MRHHSLEKRKKSENKRNLILKVLLFILLSHLLWCNSITASTFDLFLEGLFSQHAFLLYNFIMNLNLAQSMNIICVHCLTVMSRIILMMKSRSPARIQRPNRNLQRSVHSSLKFAHRSEIKVL